MDLLPAPVTCFILEKKNHWLAFDLFFSGSKFGYHGVTYGLYLDKLIEKVDPAGRTTEQVFLEDLARPYGEQ